MSLLLPREEMTYDTSALVYPYRSTTHAVLRYIELYRLMSTPRSIPLGIHKTHGGKTDSRARWQKIRDELGLLFTIFPKTRTDEWYLLTLNQATNLMPEDRRHALEKYTGKPWTKYRFERHTNIAYRDLSYKLREAELIPDIPDLDLDEDEAA